MGNITNIGGHQAEESKFWDTSMNKEMFSQPVQQPVARNNQPNND